MLTIARMTMIELWRQRAPWGFLLVGLVLLVPIFIPIPHGAVLDPAGQGQPIMTGLLGFCQFVAALLTVASAAGLVSNDRSRGTLLLTLTKPLNRWQILSGKFIGGSAFMIGVWLAWGAIASLSMSAKFGTVMILPTMEAFTASAAASCLLVAFCVFLSCLLPASSAIGLAVLGWLMASSAPKLAGFCEQLGQPTYAKAFAAMHWLLPTDILSDTARDLANQGVSTSAWAALGVILAWWLAAVFVFSRQDLAPND